ncbi:MAG TPA: hypothetical protein VF753_03460 [Terriglobales bacterium]
MENGSISCGLEQVLGTPGFRTLQLGRSPTHVNIMRVRYRDMEDTATGLRKTGTPLIMLKNDLIGPAGAMDDVGSYYFIPELSVRLGMPIRYVADVFYIGLLAGSLVIGTCGFFVLFQRWPARTITVIAMLMLAGVAYKAGDVYIFYVVSSVVAVPWVLVLVRRTRRDFWLPVFLVLMGLLIACSNWVRNYSGAGALLFICSVLILYPGATRYRKMFLLLCLFIGFAAPLPFFHRLVAQRDRVVRSYCPQYATLWSGHPMWHAIYTGLGFLQNDFGLRWEDAVTYDKVQSIAPGTLFGSPRYEQILKQETLTLTKQHPLFIFLTLTSKGGVTLAVFLLAANMGLIAAAYCRKPKAIEIAFWPAIVFNSAFGILVYPFPQYMLGLIAFGVLYAITSLGFALEPQAVGAEESRISQNGEKVILTLLRRQPERQ